MRRARPVLLFLAGIGVEAHVDAPLPLMATAEAAQPIEFPALLVAYGVAEGLSEGVEFTDQQGKLQLIERRILLVADEAEAGRVLGAAETPLQTEELLHRGESLPFLILDGNEYAQGKPPRTGPSGQDREHHTTGRDPATML